MKWLKDHEIYFKTVAATLLSCMAILISCQQCSVSRDQNQILVKQSKIMDVQKDIQAKQIDLTNTQIDLTKQQLQHSKEIDKSQLALAKKQLETANKQLSISNIQQQTAETEYNLQKRSEYLLIQDAFMETLHKVTFGGGDFGTGKHFSKMSKEEKIELLDSMIHTLTVNRNNQILLKNAEVMNVWRKAALDLQFCKNMLTYQIEHISIPDDSEPLNIEKFTDTPEKREKVVQETFFRVQKSLWAIKDKFLVESEDAKKYGIGK